MQRGKYLRQLDLFYGSNGMILLFRWDDPFGPVLLTMLLIFALAAEFVIKVSPRCLSVMTISYNCLVAVRISV